MATHLPRGTVFENAYAVVNKVMAENNAYSAENGMTKDQIVAYARKYFVYRRPSGKVFVFKKSSFGHVLQDYKKIGRANCVKKQVTNDGEKTLIEQSKRHAFDYLWYMQNPSVDADLPRLGGTITHHLPLPLIEK